MGRSQGLSLVCAHLRRRQASSTSLDVAVGCLTSGSLPGILRECQPLPAAPSITWSASTSASRFLEPSALRNVSHAVSEPHPRCVFTGNCSSNTTSTVLLSPHLPTHPCKSTPAPGTPSSDPAPFHSPSPSHTPTSLLPAETPGPLL